MFSHSGMATMSCTMSCTMSYYVILCHDCEDYPQYAETDKHQSGQVDIPKYNEELIDLFLVSS